MVRCQYGTSLFGRDTQKLCQWHGIFLKRRLFVHLTALRELRINQSMVLMSNVLAQRRKQALNNFRRRPFRHKSDTLRMTEEIGLVKLAHHQQSFDLGTVLVKFLYQLKTRAVSTDQQTIRLLLFEQHM